MRHFSFAGPMNMEHRSNSRQPLQTCRFKNFAIRSMRGKRIFIDGLACRSIISVDRPHRKTMRTQHFYRRLDAAGLIEERDVQQVWSPRDGRFLLPAGGSGSAIHFLHVGCSTSSCTVSCKEGERILNAMAFTPGGAIEYQDEHHLMFRPRRIPAVVALACIPE